MFIIAFVVFLAVLVYFSLFYRAKIAVEVAPADAVVMLDNKPEKTVAGKATFTTSFGKHTLKIESDNYIGYKEEINLSRGENYLKKITLTKAPAPITVAENAKYIATKNNEIYYYNPSDQLFYLSKIENFESEEINGQEKQKMTSEPITDFDNIIWSPNKELVIIKKNTTVSILDFKKYDFVNQSIKTFGSNIGDIAWAPDNSRIAYYYAPPTGEKSLIFSDFNNQNIYRAADLADLGIENPYLAFSPSSQYLVIIPRNSDFEQNKIYLMDIFTKEITKICNTGNQKEAVFSADSKKIVYSSFSNGQQVLSAMNIDGSENRPLGVSGKASDIVLWKNPEQLFLQTNSSGSKMIIVSISNGSTTDFYFKGQSNSNIREVILNDKKTVAIFVSNQTLRYVKLVGN